MKEELAGILKLSELLDKIKMLKEKVSSFVIVEDKDEK